jgi:hypothetical protein
MAVKTTVFDFKHIEFESTDVGKLLFDISIKSISAVRFALCTIGARIPDTLKAVLISMLCPRELQSLGGSTFLFMDESCRVVPILNIFGSSAYIFEICFKNSDENLEMVSLSSR